MRKQNPQAQKINRTLGAPIYNENIVRSLRLIRYTKTQIEDLKIGLFVVLHENKMHETSHLKLKVREIFK